MSTKWSKLLSATFVVFIALGSVLGPPAQSDSVMADGSEPDHELWIDYHDQTGAVTFIGAGPESPYDLPGISLEAVSAPDRSLRFLEHFGELLGLRDPGQELRVIRGMDGGRNGDATLRYQQIHQGIPILAGELIVNTDSHGRLLSISGEISPGLTLSTEPKLSGEQARALAIQASAKGYGLDSDDLIATEPTLWIFDERLLLQSTRPVELVWRMDVRSKSSALIDELVLVNAETGGISLHFNQVDTSQVSANSQRQDRDGFAETGPMPAFLEFPSAHLSPPPGGNRMTYTANNGSSIPGTFLCNQTQVVCTGGADPHADAAHGFAADSFNFFYDHHGRVSIDDAGMVIVSTVHYSSGYANAFWSSADQQMIYGDAYGFPMADDVVGHELTHGVTSFTSDLFYYYQSGAINESFSDMWGEFIDQTNGVGDDSSGVKWKMGEDVTGLGALRDMANPPAHGDPDKMTSPNYYTGSAELYWGTGDNGGVHTNSGVNNKAVYLMTDGDSFNGETVTALGIDKVAAIFYDVQTRLLTSGADYGDLYNALYQGCLNLLGGSEGITLTDCQEVRDAADAVEMDLQPYPGYNPEANLCGPGYAPVNLFLDDLEGGDGNWTFGAELGSSSWLLATGYSTSGTGLIWGDDYATLSDSYAAMNVDVVLPAGSQPYLHFSHAFGFEDPDYDGAWLEYSLNGGGSWNDAVGYYDSGLDYTGSIYDPGPEPGANPNRGHVAFIGDSHGYVSTRYDLSSLAGQSVRFRWRMSTDGSVWDWGWFVDDVRIFLCGDHLLFMPSAMK